jgi:hypothetical protein
MTRGPEGRNEIGPSVRAGIKRERDESRAGGLARFFERHPGFVPGLRPSVSVAGIPNLGLTAQATT